jgi:malate/lactate dehydrogenase
MAGILDTSRFRAFIAFETGASIKDVQTLVLGAGGIRSILEVDLSDAERAAMGESAAAVRDVVGVLST